MSVFRRSPAPRSDVDTPRAFEHSVMDSQSALPLHDDGSILVGVDGSSRGWNAVEWAAAEAESRQCSLRLLHAFRSTPAFSGIYWDASVVEWNRNATELATRILAEAATRARLVAPTIPITVHAREGTAAAAILRESRQGDLIVLGRGRRDDRTGSLLSVGRRVARRAHCSVAIVTLTDSSLARERSAGRIVVGVDGTENSTDVIGFAFRSAQRRAVGLTVMHAHTSSRSTPGRLYPSSKQMSACALRSATIERALQLCQRTYPDVEVMQFKYQGRSHLALLTEATGAALLVLGTPRGRSGRAPFGPVRRAALRMAQSPVAVVAPPSRARQSLRLGREEHRRTLDTLPRPDTEGQDI